ncbi:MAG: hypothetical protein M3Z04_04670 [Chloroflexota bacterium]|nr:hypothetical protein [Chloroflexota bacterium]
MGDWYNSGFLEQLNRTEKDPNQICEKWQHIDELGTVDPPVRPILDTAVGDINYLTEHLRYAQEQAASLTAALWALQVAVQDHLAEANLPESHLLAQARQQAYTTILAAGNDMLPEYELKHLRPNPYVQLLQGRPIIAPPA